MVLAVRRLRPGELDHELIWLSVSVLSAFLAAVWLALGMPWPRCLFLAITGHPCATCGATRCAIQFFHGHLLAALRWNPLIFAVFCGVFVFDIYAAVVLATRAPRLRLAPLTAGEKNTVRWMVVSALALNWIYVLLNAQNY